MTWNIFDFHIHSEQDVLLFDKLSSIFSLFVPSEIIQLGLYSKLGDFQFYFRGQDLPSHCTIEPKLTKAANFDPEHFLEGHQNV